MTTSNPLHKALEHLEQGDWSAAHKIVQSDESREACWIHGIVHLMEGDHANARYWYGKAGRTFTDDAKGEIAAVKTALA